MKKTDFAIVKIKGSQYIVEKDMELIVKKVEGKPKDKISFDEVLLTHKEGKVQIGNPKIDKAKVSAEIVEQTKGPKVDIRKFRAKSRYRRAQGHRADLTKIKITSI